MKSSVRWLVPVAVAATVAGGVAVSSAQAGSTPDLPSSTPAAVLASVAGSSVTALSGTVVTRVDLGLPALDGITGSSGAADASDPAGLVTRLLSGRNTVRVWADGPTRQRAQLLDPFSELDVVRNGDQVWTYTSRGNAVQHGTVPAHPAGKDAAGKTTGTATPSPSATELTPAAMASRAIAAADPTTAVTLGTPEQVASRKAYTLTLTPRTTATLVGRIVIAVDAQKGVPLRVQVFARGHAQPSIETGFTSIDFATPSADRFTFTPPPGATVKPLETPTSAASSAAKSLPAADRPTVTGTGWTSVVTVPAGALMAMAAAAPSGSGTPSAPSGALSGKGTAQGLAALQALTTATPAGRGLSTALVSLLLTDDGRILVGAVPLKTLVDAATAK